MRRPRRGEGESSPRLARGPRNGASLKPLDIVNISFADYARGIEFRGVGGEIPPRLPVSGPGPVPHREIARQIVTLEVATYGRRDLAAVHPRNHPENHRNGKNRAGQSN